MGHGFRFALQSAPQDQQQWLAVAWRAEQLGYSALLAHGTADRITRPGDTWLYAERARPVTEVTALEVRGGDHALLRRAHLRHRIAGDFCRASFGLATGPGVAGPRSGRRRETATGRCSDHCLTDMLFSGRCSGAYCSEGTVLGAQFWEHSSGSAAAAQ